MRNCPAAIRRTLLLCLACLAGAAGESAPAPAPAVARPRPTPLAVPEALIDGFRVYAEKVSQSVNLSLDFAPDGFGAPPQPGVRRTAGVSGRQGLQITLAVRPPKPELVSHVAGLDGGVTAETEQGNLAFTAYVAEENASATASLWRVHLSAADLALGAGRIRRLRGVILVHARARVAQLDFPLTGRLPVTREADGLRVTLRQVRHNGTTLTVTFTQEWPGNVTVANPDAEAPYGIQVLLPQGGRLVASGGGVNVLPNTGGTLRQCSATFSDVRALPAQARIELLVRSGPVRRLAFQLPDVTLPDRLPAPADPAVPDFGPLLPDHPFYAAGGGGTLVVPIGGSGNSAATGRLGLAVQAEAGWGPWRWMEVVADDPGQIRLPHLRPGRYRVRVARDPRPGEVQPDALSLEARVLMGVTTTPREPAPGRGAP